MSRYKQTKEVSWLNTPKGTIWEDIGIDSYIQPEDKNIWSTPLGVDLDLLDDRDLLIFEIIK